MRPQAVSLLALVGASAITSALVLPPNSHKNTPSTSTKVNVRRSEAGRKLIRRSDGLTKIDFDAYWFAQSRLGGQEVELLVDTGSSDLWILGPKLPAEQTNGQHIYDPARSSTVNEFQGQGFNISYLGGHGVSGPVYRDDLTVGVRVDQMPFGVAGRSEKVTPGEFSSGVLGLGFRSLNSIQPDPQGTFMDFLQPSLSNPVFTTDFKTDGTGSLKFGRIDGRKYRGDLVRLQISDTANYADFWTSANVEILTGGQRLGASDIVFDFGGPYTSAPVAVVNAYYAQVEGAREASRDDAPWIVPCNANMPDLEFRSNGGATAIVSGNSLKVVDNGDGTCQSWFTRTPSEVISFIGDPFFTSQFVVFNPAERSISWAPQA